ncbi:MAG: Ig-like domain-containing protein [Acetobacteraceae bacterium]
METTGAVRRMTPRYRAALMLAGLAFLASCMEQPAPVASGARLYAIDLSGGAKHCVVPKVVLAPGKVTPVTMQVGNDGGWCGITVALDGHPYAAGLLSTQAAHGRVHIHPVGDNTRIDYTPDSRFVGPDSFVVTLLPGRPAIHATVTVVR